MVSFPKSWSLSRHGRYPHTYARGQANGQPDGGDQLTFVFADCEDGTLNELEDATELRQRGGERTTREPSGRNERQQVPYSEHQIQEGDTLQGLALRYGCTVGRLKQFNNLLSDQDFFARTALKIPTRVHVETAKLVDPVAADRGVRDADVQSDSGDSPPDKALRYWNRLEQQVEDVIQKGSELSQAGPEAAPSNTPSNPEQTWNGVDCGIGWCGIVATLVTVGILVPTFYVLYILFYEDKSHDAVL